MTHDHLNDEQLSAHLDGEPDGAGTGGAGPGPGIEAQVAACEVCRERLAALGAARVLVRRPVAPVAPSVRAAAVEAAIAEGSALEDGARPTAAVAPGLPRRSAQPARVLVAVAALAAVLVVGVGVPLGLTHENPRTAPSASPVAHLPSSTERSAGTPKAVAGANPATAGVEDLGSIASPQALRSRLAPLLAPLDNGEFSAQAPSDATSKQSASSSTAPAPESAGTAGTVPKQFSGCLAVALRATGATEPLLVATATYEKTPALVVVARPTTTSPAAAASRLVVVVARTGCRVLARSAP